LYYNFVGLGVKNVSFAIFLVFFFKSRRQNLLPLIKNTLITLLIIPNVIHKNIFAKLMTIEKSDLIFKNNYVIIIYVGTKLKILKYKILSI